jgi:pre-60S factor REI1
MDPNAPTTTLPYTCNTCLVAFRGSDAQRDHMRKDWQYVLTLSKSVPQTL